MFCPDRVLSAGADSARYTIIDEADEMVSPDWNEEMRMVMGGGSSFSNRFLKCKDLHCEDANDDDDHVYMMFSATFPKDARAMAKEYMSKDHVRIRVGRAGSAHLNITQKVGSPALPRVCQLTENRCCMLMSPKSENVSWIFYCRCLLLVP